jgi:type VI secretion system protein ImpE
MTAKELFDAGELSGALEAISAEVRSNPGDLRRRTFLFELLAFSGDLDRAAKQLDVLAQQGVDSEIAVQTYRNALQAEAARREVFFGNRIPGLPKQIPEYTALHLKALQCLQQGQNTEARGFLEEATQFYAVLPGDINGRRFRSLGDCDDVLGPFLEVFVGPNYSWLPWESVQSVKVVPPKYLRDLLWIPAHVELSVGALGEVLLPCLYPGSHQSTNDQIRLGRITDWRGDLEGLSIGLGQKLLAVDDEELAIAEVRQIDFDEAVQVQDAGSNG